jgi:hypothetical protein
MILMIFFGPIQKQAEFSRLFLVKGPAIDSNTFRAGLWGLARNTNFATSHDF